VTVIRFLQLATLVIGVSLLENDFATIIAATLRDAGFHVERDSQLREKRGKTLAQFIFPRSQRD
jgi:hypothetical protein